MTRQELIEQIQLKKSFLCVGLDTDLSKIPAHLLETEDPIFEFNKAIIDATAPYAVAYKPNIAFYEKLGPQGWVSLQKTLEYIPANCFTIADAKRGDIGNTSRYYAETFFETYAFDSITVAPYMGEDSVRPFTDFKGKWTIVLGLTSNKGSLDFQHTPLSEGGVLFEKVLKEVSNWGTKDNLMFVVGATRGEAIAQVRKVIPDHFLLVPGVGAQGGSLEEVVQFGMNDDCGLLVNSSRGIIYADASVNFAQVAGEKALEIQSQMANYL